MKAQSEQYIPAEIANYKKSNFLISGKYKASLLENKIMAISLARSSQFEFGESEDSPVYSRIKIAELRNLVGGNKGSFYNSLRTTAEAMTGKTIGMSSPDSKTFDFVAVVTRARCSDGIFTIEYNHAIKEYLVEITRNFTRLNLQTMLRFKNNHSLRIYELLKSKCYRGKFEDASSDEPYYVNIELNELKLELGIVNPENEKVKKVLRGTKKPDYEKAVELAPEKMFDRWADFQRKVLRVAVDEINEVSDMKVHYQPVKQGRGGKVTQINFTIFLDQKPAQNPSDSVQKNINLSDEELFTLILDIRSILGDDFSARDIHAIAVAADFDIEKIRMAHEILKSAGEVENPTGFMISAIKGGYRKPQKKTGADKSKEFTEAYSKAYVEEMVDYDALFSDPDIDMDDLDAVINVLYDAVNTTKKTLRVMGDDKPVEVVKSVLLKLQASDIEYVISQINTVGRDGIEIKNSDAYILTLLYRAKDQGHISLSNLGHRKGDF